MATDSKKPVAKKATAPARFKQGEKVKYSARTHDGKGVFVAYESSARGEWVNITRNDNGKPLLLRPSQIKRA